MKRFKVKKTVAVLCLCSALCAGAGFALGRTLPQFPQTAIVAAAENEQGGAGLLDLNQSFNEKSGQPSVDNATNVITFIFPSLNMKDGGWMENAVVTGEGGTAKTAGDYIVVSDGTTAKTVNEWKEQNGGTRAFRVAVYGKALILQFEASNVISKDGAKWVRFKTGFCLFEGTDGTQADWVLTKSATTKVANTDFAQDLTLYLNRDTGKYEYLADETAQDALTVTGTATKTEYFVGEAFDASGLSLSVKTADGATKEIPLAAEMCTYDFSEAGEKEVTVAYGGAEVKYSVTVQAAAKELMSIDVSAATFNATKYSLPYQFTVKKNSKLTLHYNDESTEEIDLTKDMIPQESLYQVGLVDTHNKNDNTMAARTCPISVSRFGKTVSANVPVSVNTTKAGTNLSAQYGTSGKVAVGTMALSFKYADGSNQDMKAINGLKTLPSFAYEKNEETDADGKKTYTNQTLGDIVLLKWKNEETEKSFTELGNGYDFGMYGATMFLTIPDALKDDVEYVRIGEGFLIYGHDENDLGGAHKEQYTPRVYADKCMTVNTEIVIGWTADSTQNFGETEKAYKDFQIIVPEGSNPEFYVSQNLTDADLKAAGITYRGTYVADGKSLTGDVTAAMCSAVPSATGEAQITVTLGRHSAVFNVTVVERPALPESLDLTGITLTAKRYSVKKQIVIPEGTKFVVHYSAGGEDQEVLLTTEMLGAVDTSQAGETECVVSYTEKGETVTGRIRITVSAEKAPSAIAGINYGADGMSSVENQRNLQIKYNGTVGGHQAYNQLGCAGLIPGSTTGKLFLVKVKGQSELKTLDSFVGQGGLDFRLYTTEAFVYIPSNEVEYVVLKEGLVLYNYSENDNAGTHRDEYFPITNENGDIAYIDHDIYLTWTSQSAGDRFGKVVEPLKDLEVTLAESVKKEYYPGEDLELAGVTYTAKYVDPAKEGQTATGNVTVDMCSRVPDNIGSAQITVTVNGTTATFGITVLEAERVPLSIALKEGSALTYQRYAIEPTIKEDCTLVVTYDDQTTKEVLMKKEWITLRPDTSKKSKQNVTISYKEYGKTVTATVEVQVWEKAVESNIKGVSFGAAENAAGWFGVTFDYAAGGSDGLKAIDNIAGLASVNPAKKNGDLVLIKFSKKTDLIALSDSSLSKLQPGFYGGTFVLRETDKLTEEFGNIEYLVIKAGFLWYSATGDQWGVGNNADTSTYFPVASNVVTKDLYVGFNGGKLEKPVSEIAIEKDANYKTAYIKGEDLSLNFHLVITYLDPSEKSVKVAATRDMCGEVTGNATAAQAEISYRGKSFVIDGLTYDESKELGGLVIETTGKTQYSFAVEEFDLSGYVVKMIVKDAATGNEVERRTVDNAEIEIDGFDSHALGNQTVKLVFSGKETNADVTVVNDEPEKHMTIEYMATYDSYDRSQLHGLAVHFGFTTEVGNVQSESFLYAAELPNVADKLLVNGKLASEWIKEGAIQYIGFYGTVVYVRFTTDKLQPTKTPTQTPELGYGSYTEGVTDLVETVTFLPGFQFYSVEKNYWGNTGWTKDDVTPVKHGVVKEKITLENIDFGNGWVRQFKLNAEGTAMADDAMTVASLPSKTKFTVGEEITKDALLDGLTLHFKYQDGGEEDWQPGVMDIEFADDITAAAGKKTVTVYFKDNEHYVSFEIEVAEKAKPKGLSGGAIAGIVIGSVLGAGAIAAASVVLVKKQKGKKGENE